ncbi:MAG: DMT family transporter [Pseudomonadota bacterium]
MTHTLTTRVWLELTLLALIWGGSFLAIRTALDEIGFLASVSHRVLWAALVLWGIALLRGQTMPRSLRLWGAFLVMGLLNNVLPFSLMAWGQLHIETGLTAILNAATAIWGVFVAALVFPDERLTTRRLTGVLIGFLGVATAIGLANITKLDLRSLAQLAVIAGTISYAFAGSWARAQLKDVPPLLSAAGMLTGSTLIMLPVTFAVEGGLPLALEPRTWGAIAYYSVAATAFAYLLYYRILAAAGAGNLLLVTLMIPPVAILLGAWARDEALAANAYLGFTLLALGLLILDGRLLRLLRQSD